MTSQWVCNSIEINSEPSVVSEELLTMEVGSKTRAFNAAGYESESRVFSLDQIEEHHEAFNTIDKDGSGFIDKTTDRMFERCWNGKSHLDLKYISQECLRFRYFKSKNPFGIEGKKFPDSQLILIDFSRRICPTWRFIKICLPQHGIISKMFFPYMSMEFG